MKLRAMLVPGGMVPPRRADRRVYTRRGLLAMGGGLGAGFLVGACAGDGDGGAVTKLSPVSTPSSASSTVPGESPTSTPPPELLLSAVDAVQSGTILASLVGAVTGGIVSFMGRQYPLTQGSQSMYSFVGVAIEDPAGEAELKVDFTYPNGSTGSITETVLVGETAWPTDAVEVPPELVPLLSPQVQAAELLTMKDVYDARTPEKLWSGEWRIPVDGPITTQFGEVRSYNGGAPSGHHAGVDLGAETGTVVKATNSGRVVMAKLLSIHGNMVVVDHGGGLLSGYAHLQDLGVLAGQLVAGGDTLGVVGTTGLSTGAHLHWEVSASGVLVDAWRFVDGSNGF